MGSPVWGNGFYARRSVGRTQGGVWGLVGGTLSTAALGYIWKKYQEKKEAQAAEEAERKAKRAERMKAEYEGQKAAAEDTSESDTREDGTEDTHPDQSN